jgi:pilus assembly protein Flp/PilA
MVRRFLRSKDGSTAVEYALIAGFLVLAIAASVMELGRVVGETYDNLAERVTSAPN